MQFKNIIWNLIGLGLPLIIAALTIPNLIGIIGTERFGLLALAWGLIGYAGALDLGIGRALTQRLAMLRGRSEDSEIPQVIVTAVTLTTILGLFGFSIIALACIFGAQQLIPRVDVANKEITISLLLLAVAVPMQAVSATYKGVNEAYLNFKSINILRVALGVANFGGPYLVSYFTHELHWLVATLVVSRTLALLVYRYCAYTCVALGKSNNFNYPQAIKLLKFGGWVTVSGVISPFLVQADRFFIGFLISAAAVTTYVIPYEISVQALILVGAITTVAFPTIAELLQRDRDHAWLLFKKWVIRVAILMFIVMGGIAVLLPIVLELWVGAYVAEDSVTVGRILCLGVFFNALGAMFYSFLHAQGRTKITALFHLIEFPLFVAALYLLITKFGVQGAALAWLLRVIVDSSLLIWAVTVVKKQGALDVAR